MKPDITLPDFETKEMVVIEFSSPSEKNISRKEEEKWFTYLDLLSIKFRKLYPAFKVKLVVLCLIVGLLDGLKASLLPIQKAKFSGSLCIVLALDLA